jgi:DNA-binding MarR family transcriptional regulator
MYVVLPPERGDLQPAVDALRRIVQLLRDSSRAVERELGVSGAQLFVLQHLADAPASSLNELAERTYTHQSSVSVVVSRLVERRLVARAPSAADGRRLELSITPAGRALLKRAPEAAPARVLKALEELPRRDLRAMTRALERVVGGMGGTKEPPEMFFEGAGSGESGE